MLRINYTKQSIFETTLYKKQVDICQKLMFQKMCIKGRASPWVENEENIHTPCKGKSKKSPKLFF